MGGLSFSEARAIGAVVALEVGERAGTREGVGGFRAASWEFAIFAFVGTFVFGVFPDCMGGDVALPYSVLFAGAAADEA